MFKNSYGFRCIAILGLLTLTACHGDDLPDSTVTSKNLDTNEIHLDFQVQAQDAETDPDDNGVHLLVTLYRITNSGFIQFVNLAEGDSLSLNSDGTNIPLTKNSFPGTRAVAIDYSAQIDQIVDGDEFVLALNRQSGDSVPNLSATVLPPTVFSVTPSTTPLTSTGSLTLNWTAISDYEYQVSFRFSCGVNGDQYVQGIRFPNYYSSAGTVSPFVFNFDDYFDFPPDTDLLSNIANCQLRATLWSSENQSAEANENANISSTRVQRISTAIQR